MELKFLKKELSLSEQLEDVKSQVQEQATDRAKLTNAVRQAENEHQAEVRLGDSYKSDGESLRGVSDDEIERLQPRRQRTKLVAVSDARGKLAEFDSRDRTAELQQQAKQIHQRMEDGAKASAMSDDLEDCHQLIQHFEAAAVANRRLIDRRAYWQQRDPGFTALHDDLIVPKGVLELETKTDPVSSLLGSIRLMSGRQHPTLVSDADPLKKKIEHSFREGFEWSGLKFPTR